MTTGFQAINSSGVVQIDQDTANFALVLKSTGTFTNLSFGSVVIRYCLFTVTGLRNPVLAVQTASGIDFWSGMKANGSGSFSFYVYSAGAAASSTCSLPMLALQVRTQAPTSSSTRSRSPSLSRPGAA